jgi:hypothetical protein
VAATAGSPNSRRLARAAARIGSAQTGLTPTCSASQPAGPPTPEPASSIRRASGTSSASASQVRLSGLPEPRHAAAIA